MPVRLADQPRYDSQTAWAQAYPDHIALCSTLYEAADAEIRAGGAGNNPGSVAQLIYYNI